MCSERQRVEIDCEDLDRARNVVAAVKPRLPWVTLRWLLSRGIDRACDEFETLYNRGEAFPQRDQDLVGGRPPKD